MQPVNTNNPLSNFLAHQGLVKINTPDKFVQKLDNLDFNLGSGGISYQLLIEFLYVGRMLRYFTQSQIKRVYKRYDKIAGKPKLKKLLDTGYLKSRTKIEEKVGDKTILVEVYQVTDKPKLLFEAVGLNWAVLTYGRNLDGQGKENEILNTNTLINLMKEPHFYHFFHLQFPKNFAFIVPDSLMVLRDEGRYKLKFIELENTKKGDWEKYVFNKQSKYRQLASGMLAFSAWQSLSNKLKLHVPKVSEFCFSVRFIGDFDFVVEKGDGIEFRGL